MLAVFQCLLENSGVVAVRYVFKSLRVPWPVSFLVFQDNGASTVLPHGVGLHFSGSLFFFLYCLLAVAVLYLFISVSVLSEYVL